MSILNLLLLVGSLDVAPILAQAASTPLFSEPPVPDDQTSLQLELRCLIQGLTKDDDAEPFTITVSVNKDIGDLKALIHERGKNRVLSGVDAVDLVLSC